MDLRRVRQNVPATRALRASPEVARRGGEARCGGAEPGVDLQRMRTRVRVAGVAAGAPPVARHQGLPVRRLWQGVRHQDDAEEPPEDAHEGAAVQVRDVRQGVLALAYVGVAHSHPQEPEAVRVQGVRQVVQTGVALEAAPAAAQRRKALRLSVLWKMFHCQGELGGAYTFAHGGNPVQMYRLR